MRGWKTSTAGAKNNLQLPGLQRGAVTESNSFRAVRGIMTITFFHVRPRLPTEGIHRNSDSGTSHGALRYSCHASIWLIDRTDLRERVHIDAGVSQGVSLRLSP